MATTIRLFRAGKQVSFEKLFELTPEKLFQLDDIEAYLSNKNKVTISNYQYVKFELEMTLKLNLEEFLINPNADERFVYMAIHNPDMPANTWIYYFIKDFEWRSEHCVAVNILCDVLNTFAGRYEFNKKTLVKREHRDRYELYQNWQVINLISADYPTEETYYQLNSSIDENATDMSFTPTDDDYIALYVINTSQKTIRKVGVITAIDNFVYQEGSFYLCRIHLGEENFPLFASDLNTGRYFIAYHGNASQDMEDWLTNLQNINKQLSMYEKWIYKIDRINEDLNPVLLTRGANVRADDGNASLDNFNHWYLVYYSVYDDEVDPPKDTGVVDCYLVNEQGHGGTQELENWNMSDPRIIKVIELPYCPVLISEESPYIPIGTQVVQFPQDSDATHLSYKLNDLHIRFYSELDLEDNQHYIYKDISKPQNSSLEYCSTTTGRGFAGIKETKLFNSEFFIPKFFYDSFSFPVICENLDISSLHNKFNVSHNDPKIIFYATSTVNSRFAFKFDDNVNKYNDNDYPSFLLVARNNEMTLYNSAYLNYIKTGYNYDIKNKNTSNLMTWLGAGASILGTAASVGTAIATGGLAVPLAVGSATSTAMTITSAVAHTITNERNMEQKLAQLRNQAVSVYGSDDIDLLRRYNGNALLYNEYKPSDEVEKLIDDLFYYTGYATKRMGVPNTNNRLYFNFVQCEPVLDYKLHTMSANWVKAYSIPKSFQTELEKIMRTGYTILHKVDGIYDFNQEYENYETSVYNYYHGGN